MDPHDHDSRQSLNNRCVAPSQIQSTFKPNQSFDSTQLNSSLQENQEEKQASITTFPEGGVEGWKTVLGSYLIQFISFGYITAIGVFQDYYIRVLLTDYTPSEIGWIGGVQLLLTFFLGLFVGHAFDKGYFYYLMIAGCFLQSFGLFMLSLAHQNSYYQVFLSNGICFGLGSGLTYIPSLGILGHYFQRRRPLVMGISSSGAALGSLLHPIILNHLINGRIGFANGVRISAAINTVISIIAICFLRTRLPPKKNAELFPVKLVLKIFKEPTYILATLYTFFGFLGMFFPLIYLQVLAILSGVDKQFSFYSLSILNATSLVSRIVIPAFVPRLGLFNLTCLFSFFMVIVVFAMGPAAKDLTVTGTALIAVFYGFSSGPVFALTPAVFSQLAKSPDEIGIRIGLGFGFAGVTGLFSSPIIGALLTTKYHWSRATVFAGVVLLVSASMLTTLRFIIAKRKGTQIV